MLFFPFNKKYFYSHTPHGVQRRCCFKYLIQMKISTHTPLTGCNEKIFIKFSKTGNFYSHTPHGVQHHGTNPQVMTVTISTHTPLTGCNIPENVFYRLAMNFYSHTPHGVQLPADVSIFPMPAFLLTHPSRGATTQLSVVECLYRISTHTPLTGCNLDRQWISMM